MKVMLQKAFAFFCLLLVIGCSKPAIEGQIVDDLGLPIENATIKIKNSSVSSNTNSQGEYSISFIPGEIDLIISKKGYVSAGLSLNISEKTRYPAEKVVLPKIPTIMLQKPASSSETVMGKSFIIEGKIDRPADVFLKGKKIKLDDNNSFNLKVDLRFGENKFIIEARPIQHSESTSLNVLIKREYFPAEKEYYKSSEHINIHNGRLNDFAIDENNNYLVTVKGHYEPRLYDLKNNKLVKILSKLKKDNGHEQAVTFSADNKYLLVGIGYLSYIEIYETKTFNSIKTIYVDNGAGRFATCKKNNLNLSTFNGIWVLDNKTFKKVGFFQPFWSAPLLKISNQCNLIASKGGDRTITITDANKPYDISQMKDAFRRKNWDKMKEKISKRSQVSHTRHAKVTDIVFLSESEIISGTSKGEIILSKINKDMSLSEINSIGIGTKIKSLAVSKINKLLIVGTEKKIYYFDIPSLKFKLDQNQGAIKILVSNSEKSFYYQTEYGIRKAPLDINWNLITEYYQLINQGKI